MNITFYSQDSHAIIENIRRSNTIFSIGQSYGEFFLSCQISKDEIFEFYIESVSKGINSTVHYHSGCVFIQDECPVCFELFIPDRISRCGHYTCYDCMKQMLKYNLKSCPLCRYEYNYN